MRTPQPVSTTGRRQQPPHAVRTISERPVRRVGAIDRAALRLGVALIRWGRRPVRIDIRKRAALNAESWQARRQLEMLRNQHAANLLRFR